VSSVAEPRSIASRAAQSAALAPVVGAAVVSVGVAVSLGADVVGAAGVVVAAALVAVVAGAAAGVVAEQPASRARPVAVTARVRAKRRTVFSRVGVWRTTA
jgi:hypothetical protein